MALWKRPLLALCQLCLLAVFLSCASSAPRRKGHLEDGPVAEDLHDYGPAWRHLERVRDVVTKDDDQVFDHSIDFQSIHCRTCGRAITDESALFDFTTRHATSSSNLTLFRRGHSCLAQTFTNPAGNSYELVTAKKASLEAVSSKVASSTWWDGYEWTIASCPVCHSHLGWIFERTEKFDEKEFPPSHPIHDRYPVKFAAIILSKLERGAFVATSEGNEQGRSS